MAPLAGSSRDSPHSNTQAFGLSNNLTASCPRTPRTLPPWIDSYDPRFGQPFDILNQAPSSARVPHHNNTPTPPQRRVRRVSQDGFVEWDDDGLASAPTTRHKITLQERWRRRGGAERGRKWDHLRSADPVVVSSYLASNNNLWWRDYLVSSEYGHLANEHSEVVDPEKLDELQPGFNRPIDQPLSSNHWRARGRRRAALYRRIWRLIIRHPLIPLVFRLGVLFTSIVALALSAHIFRQQDHSSNSRGPDGQDTQLVFAIVVDSVAIPYIGYMTWDEYTGKPLGLRPAIEKSSFILLDLFFIIFKSCSTTLAFNTLANNLSEQSPRDAGNMDLKALAAFLLIGLVSWGFTFSVNVFRLVSRLGGADEQGSHL